MKNKPKMSISPAGTKKWVLHGKFHREDGPAVEYARGDQHWYKHGKRHREDGPAFERADGSYSWWFKGYVYSFDEYVKVAGWDETQIIQWKLQHDC